MTTPANYERYGYWTVIGPDRTSHVLCRCDCGTERAVYVSSLTRGGSRSCGCQKTALLLKSRRPKYLYRSPEYVAWHSAVHRCTNPRASSWRDYGGRGIAVCDRWLNGENGQTGFECFLSDMGERPDGGSLERRDVNGGYSPKNCEWLAMRLQNRNTRRARHIQYGERFISGVELAEIANLDPKIVYYRLDLGWSVEDIIARPAGWRPSKYKTKRMAHQLSDP